MVCLGNICINTLQKGAKYDVDDDKISNIWIRLAQNDIWHHSMKKVALFYEIVRLDATLFISNMNNF
jgi:hypothetical protein